MIVHKTDTYTDAPLIEIGGRRVLSCERSVIVKEASGVFFENWNTVQTALQWLQGIAEFAPWAEHPANADLFVCGYAVEPMSADMLRFKVRYLNKQPVFAGGGELVTVETDLERPDPDAAQFTFEQLILDPGAPHLPQVGTYNALLPSQSFIMRRIEKNIDYGGVSPYARQREFLEHVNSQSFLNLSPGKWICLRASFDEQGLEGIGYWMTFELVSSVLGWNERVAYRDASGNAVAGVDPHEVIRPSVDFAPLLEAAF